MGKSGNPMRSSKQQQTESELADAVRESPELEVTIEIPSGSFLKRGSTGQVDFISPFPCPFNYGSVEKLIGLEGDLLDAVVLGPRLPRGTRVTVRAFGAVGLTDRGMYDDKLICSHHPVGRWQRSLVLFFFIFYARCKWLLNLVRGQKGHNACQGWGDPKAAIARARPRNEEAWQGPVIPF
jgi:inorganic pyrophosphatase